MQLPRPLKVAIQLLRQRKPISLAPSSRCCADTPGFKKRVERLPGFPASHDNSHWCKANVFELAFTLATIAKISPVGLLSHLARLLERRWGANLRFLSD